MNRRYVSFSIDFSEETKWIFDELKKFFEKSTGVEIFLIKKQIHYHEFGEGDFFSVHDDFRDNRLYSVGVLLNDDFEGGDFNLYNPGMTTLKKIQGNAYIFDSRIPHEITKITTGKRTSMIWFLQVNNFKNIIERII